VNAAAGPQRLQALMLICFVKDFWFPFLAFFPGQLAGEGAWLLGCGQLGWGHGGRLLLGHAQQVR
jgi:hypothetical protein